MQSQLSAKDTELERYAVRVRSQLAAKDAEHEKNLTHAKKSIESEAERVQRRTEAEAADLRATISRFEVDLLKVRE